MPDLTFVRELIAEAKRAKAQDEIDAIRRQVATQQCHLETIKSRRDAALAQIRDHNKRLHEAITCAAELEGTKDFLNEADYEKADLAIDVEKENAIAAIKTGEAVVVEANGELGRANDEIRSQIAKLRALGDTSYDVPRTLADVRPEAPVLQFIGRHGGEIQKLRQDLNKLDDNAPMLWAKNAKLVSLYCKLYAGTCRRILEYADLTEEERELATRSIKKAHAISGAYGNGHIDALRRSFKTDWDAYISNALKELTRHIDVAEANKHFTVIKAQPPSRPSEVLATAKQRVAIELDQHDDELMERILNSGLLAVTAGKRLAIVGGDGRTSQLVDWIGDALKLKRARHYEPRDFSKIRDSINANGIDLLIILTCFINHGMERPVTSAAKARGCPIAFLNSTSKAEAVKAIATAFDIGGWER